MQDSGLETKFARLGEAVSLRDGAVIEGYASVFGVADQGGDVVMAGAYGRSLKALSAEGRRVKMLWQHDPAEPIGVWEELREDGRGLYVKGRILTDVARGREAAALISAGEPARLMGYPVLVAEDMPDIGSGNFAIAFGDYKNGYTIAERPDLRVLRDPFSAKPHVLFYASKRVGGDVSDFAAIKLLKFALS